MGVKLRALLVTASLAAWAGFLATPAGADFISFNPSGTGAGAGAFTGVQNFTYSTGNVNAQGIGTAAPPVVGTTFTINYQSVLSSISGTNGVLGGANAGGNFITPGGTLSGNEFTVVAGFRETISTVTLQPGGGSNSNGPGSVGGAADAATITFADASTPGLSTNPANPNFFQIYAVPAGTSNTLAGTGFAGTPAQLILSGHLINPGFTGSFKEDGTISGGGAVFTPHTENLDQSGNGGGPSNPTYAATRTVTGNGSTILNVAIDSYNANFFPSPPPSIIQLAFTTTNTLPIKGVSPTDLFYNGSTTYAPNVGAINGVTGPDLMFQSVAQNSFTAGVIPEPSTITMALAALLGVPVLSRVSRNRNKANVA